MSASESEESDDSYAYPSSDEDTEMSTSSSSCSSNKSNNIVNQSKNEPYLLLDPVELAARKTSFVTDLSDLLNISTDAAQILLRNNKPEWEPSSVQEAWFSNQAALREKIGLPLLKTQSKLGKRTREDLDPTCPICYSDLNTTTTTSATAATPVTLNCEHFFCSDCFASYLQHELSSGSTNSSTVECPAAKCNVKISETLIKAHTTNAIYQKFTTAMLRSFVDVNRSARWCPSSNCSVAVEYTGGGNLDINCKCGHSFCFTCGSEGHRPASCENVGKWMIKNADESENVTWIMANTKACPKCKVNIEKNQGCQHMTCHSNTGGCGHQFCWICKSKSVP
tara:strand:- start:36 stop:1049 length:1014 start_codon:yes stop_codon:yes gene_type:complete